MPLSNVISSISYGEYDMLDIHLKNLNACDQAEPYKSNSQRKTGKLKIQKELFLFLCVVKQMILYGRSHKKNDRGSALDCNIYRIFC